MNKFRLYVALCGLILTVQTVLAQENTSIVGNNGVVRVIPNSQIEYATFNTDSCWFSITNDGIDGIRESFISASCTVALATDGVIKKLSTSPRIGVCYSREDTLPSIDDTYIILGTQLKSYSFSLPSLLSGTTYYYRVFIDLDGVLFYGDVVRATTTGEKPIDRSKTINGHKFVDLGLPSGLLWAETNIGAQTAEEDGNKYAWGEFLTKDNFSSSNHRYSSTSGYTKYNSSDGKITLEPEEDDAAYVNWGAPCRMPSDAEVEELKSSDICTWTWTSIPSPSSTTTNGYKVVSKTNGNSIFLPAAGYQRFKSSSEYGNFGCYWSSTRSTEDESSGLSLTFSNSNDELTLRREYGLSVRAVVSSNKTDSLLNIVNGNIDSITSTKITASCNIMIDSIDSISSISEIGVCYSYTNTLPTITDSCLYLGTEPKEYAFTLSSLAPSTDYYYRIYVKQADSITYGGLVCTKTSNPTFRITSSKTDSITATSITASYLIALDGDSASKFSTTPSLGVCYSRTDSIPTISSECLTLGTDLKEYSFTLSPLIAGTNYYYRLYVKLADSVYYGDIVSVTTLGTKPHDRIINGHKFIDLGLASGLLWAETNLGAETAADRGNYYAWGETLSKTYYGKASYEFFFSRYEDYTKYNSTDNLNILDKEDDAAYINWGACRIPTDKEFAELRNPDNCTWTWVRTTNSSENSVYGFEVVSKINGNSIFLPVYGFKSENKTYSREKGCYWSSTMDTDGDMPKYLYFDVSGYDYDYKSTRHYGLTIRPVAQSNCDSCDTIAFDIVDDSANLLISTDSISASCTITRNLDCPGDLEAAIEVGVCFSRYNSSPTISDESISLGSSLGKYHFSLTSLISGVNYYYRVFVKLADKIVYGGLVKATTLRTNQTYTTVNNYRFVDLGLPSGTLWAETNIGAKKEADDGYYFAWGETSILTKSIYWWDSYEYGSSSDDITKYNASDGITVLDNNDDAAYVNCGYLCHTPTYDEMLELEDSNNCSWDWVSMNNSYGVSTSGYKITSKVNGNWIFLPAAGWRVDNNGINEHGSSGSYLTSTLYPDSYQYAWAMFIEYLYKDKHNIDYAERVVGHSVRPVAKP